jgi:DnaK suppressor protein
MDSQQATPYRQQLQAMHTALLAQIAEQRGGVVGRAQAAADHFADAEDSSAQMATSRELEFALGERETDELAAIDAALARIEAGSYGDCVDRATAGQPRSAALHGLPGKAGKPAGRLIRNKPSACVFRRAAGSPPGRLLSAAILCRCAAPPSFPLSP